MKSNQMKYLLALLHQPRGKWNQAGVARIFGVNKSTVSRNIVEYVKKGILYEGMDGYELTDYGRKLVEEYEVKYKTIYSWLVDEGIKREEACSDVFNIIDSCSDETVQMLKQKGRISSFYKNLEEFKGNTTIRGSEIIAYLEPGEYIVPFTFYRKEYGIDKVSMANEAFYHPAKLIVNKNGSYMCMGMKNIVRTSRINHKKMKGHLKTMAYMKGHIEKNVLVNDEKIYIPIHAIKFVYIEQDHILQGYIEVIVTCTVGTMHMPKSKATIMFYFK